MCKKFVKGNVFHLFIHIFLRMRGTGKEKKKSNKERPTEVLVTKKWQKEWCLDTFLLKEIKSLEGEITEAGRKFQRKD